MSRQDSEAVSFHEASSYFSEEEWTLLQEWQKELCGNLMKEIHQVLISLGPLIATTVFSLKAKEKQKLYTQNNEEAESDSVSGAPSLANLKKPCLAGLYGLGEEITEPSTSPDSEQHNIISFSIKDEEESYCPDDDDFMTVESISIPTGELITSPSKLSRINGDTTAQPVQDTDGGDQHHCCTTDIFVQKAEAQVPVSNDHIVEKGDVRIKDPDSKDDELAYCKDHDDSARIESIGCSTEVPVITAVFSLSTKPEEEPRSMADLSDPGSMTAKESSMCCESKMNFTHGSALNQCQIIQLEEKNRFTECETRFIRNISFLHQETKQTGVQSFSSNNCEKNFTQKTHVQCHQRIHMGEKTFLCNECGKSFSRQTSLKRHRIVHYGNNPFPCTECGRSFVYKTDLDRHQKFHRGEKPFPCSICGKAFMYKSHLQRHLIFHTGERPFPCSKCDKRFAQKITLLKHQKVHNGGWH